VSTCGGRPCTAHRAARASPDATCVRLHARGVLTHTHALARRPPGPRAAQSASSVASSGCLRRRPWRSTARCGVPVQRGGG
jgi:hypothetical protein